MLSSREATELIFSWLLISRTVRNGPGSWGRVGTWGKFEEGRWRRGQLAFERSAEILQALSKSCLRVHATAVVLSNIFWVNKFERTTCNCPKNQRTEEHLLNVWCKLFMKVLVILKTGPVLCGVSIFCHLWDQWHTERCPTSAFYVLQLEWRQYVYWHRWQF